jgi:hypothetical protein
MRAKLSIAAVVVIGGLTALFFFVARGEVRSEVQQEAKSRLEGTFAAVWEKIESNAHEAVRRSADVSNAYRKEFLQAMRAQRALSDALEAKVRAMEPEKRPDLAMVILKGRVLAAYVPEPLLQETKGASDEITNRSCDIEIAEEIFAKEVKRKAGAPASPLAPAGWQAPPVNVGKLDKGKLFSSDLPTAAAAPVVLTLKKGRPAAQGAPKRLAALVVAWKQEQPSAKAKEAAEALAGDDSLRVNKFWPAYVGLRVTLTKIILVTEKRLRAGGRAPEFMALLDGKGIVLHRNKNTEYLVGESLAARYLSVNTALTNGMGQSDIWSQGDLRTPTDKAGKKEKDAARSNLLRIGVTPIFGEAGQIIGGVCMGWTLSDKLAAQIHDTLGVGVVFLEQDKVMASAALPPVPASVIEELKASRVETKKYSPADGTAVFENLEAKEVELGGKKYYAAAGVMAGARDVGAHTYLVFVSASKQMAPFEVVPWTILGLGFLSLVLVLILLSVLARHFLKPIDEIYNGVNEMLAGDMDYTFGVPSAETEGLCYALNALLAKLLGRPEPEDEEEEVEESVEEPASATVALGPLPSEAIPANDPAVSDLVGESDEAHLKRVFDEYVTALDEYGMDVSGFTFKDFRDKIQANERMLKGKYECSAVRFKLGHDEDGAPILIPLAVK